MTPLAATLLVRCDRPGRALRRDVPPRPRVLPLAEVLVERRAAVVALLQRGGADPAVAPAAAARRREADLDDLARRTRPLAVRVLGAVAEVAARRRPLAHLAGVCAPGVLDVLGPRLAALGEAGLRVGGVRVCAVGPDALEVAAVLHGPRRSRAVAARIEREPPGVADPADTAGAGWRLRSLAVL